MGDRANIALHFSEGDPIYLYTNWSGREWPERLRQALEFGRGRWQDEPYLARIITSRVFADLVDSETGGGLAPYLTDGDDRVVHVWLDGGVVSFNKADGDGLLFEDFVAKEPWHWPV